MWFLRLFSAIFAFILNLSVLVANLMSDYSISRLELHEISKIRPGSKCAKWEAAILAKFDLQYGRVPGVRRLIVRNTELLRKASSIRRKELRNERVEIPIG